MSQTNNDQLTFEQSLIELERAVRELEEGRLGLDDALARYEQGIGLIKRCYGQLREAEQRILVLTGAEADNGPVLQAFKHEATVSRNDTRRLRRPPEESV